MVEPNIASGAAPQVVRPKKERFDSLQVLRGLSALAVLLSHSHFFGISMGAGPDFWNMFLFGRSGVDVFFVLSGFIMYYVHESDLGRPSRVKSFALKRVIRIYPIYWILTLAILPAFYLAPGAIKAYKGSPSFIFQSLALLPQHSPPIIPPAWSLAYEMKFYLFFALVICIPKRISRWLVGLMVALSVAVYVVQLTPATHMLYVALAQHFYLLFLIHPYNLQFAAGALCAFILTRYSFPIGARIGFFAAGVLLYATVAILETPQKITEEWMVLCYGVPSALLLFGTAALNYKSRSRFYRSLVFLGEASYSLYLIHFPFCMLACMLMLKFGVVRVTGLTIATSLMVCSAVAAGCMFHLLVEKPILIAGHRFISAREKASSSEGRRTIQ